MSWSRRLLYVVQLGVIAGLVFVIRDMWHQLQAALPEFATWLGTPMDVSYAQVLGAGCLLLFFLWLSSTLALWLHELGKQVKTLRAIEHHQLGRVEALQDSVALLKEALLRRAREDRCGRAIDGG